MPKIREMEEGIRRIRTQLGAFSHDVMIVAATKMVEAERINALREFGITHAGENRAQELVEKFPLVSGITWHFIGNLQKNKVKYIIDKVDLIHSVDDLSLAKEIDKQAQKHGKIMDILLEVNVASEPSKGGVSLTDLQPLIESVAMLKGVRIRGLMSVLPIAATEDMYKAMQNAFIENREKYGFNKYPKSDTSNSERGTVAGERGTVAGEGGVVAGERGTVAGEGGTVAGEGGNLPSFDYLSMGMSDDYVMALKYGANIIRPGSAIFGKRNY